MKQKRNKTWKRMFSMLLVMAMLITAIPVTAFAEPEARAIRVWFEYDDGNTQELDENGEFHLTTEDKGTFKAEGYSSRRVGWMIFKQINQYTKENWADYNSGVFQPQNESIVLPSWLEDFDTEQKLVEFKVNVEKAASIVEVKAFSGDREISMDAPCQMNGSEAQTLTLKVRKDNSEEFEPLALSNFDIEKVSGEGMILPADGTFRVDGQEAVFKATLKSDPSIFVEFKAVSSGVALQAISVSVPQVWYIDSWNGLADYYVGIQKGDNPDNNYKINYTPSNASDKEVVWEPLTEDIATHMEAFDNGIVPKKAGIAKFKVSSKSNPEISTEVSVEFRYKYPLTAANVEKEEYTVEEGNKLEFNIKATPEHATEQRFHWSYSKEGIVEVKDSVSQDALNVNTPKTTQHVINALKTGKVTVTGMPFDETGSCKPVSFDVVVTKDGEVTQGDALVMAKEDIAHGVQYLQGKSLEKYEDEWNIFSILRSGATIEQSKLDKYYESVVKQLKKSGKTMRVTDLARVALALEAMGKNPTDVGGFNVLEAIYNHKDMMTDSSNCPIFGLLALDGRNYEIPKDAKWSRKDLIDQILKFQKASGGFGLSLDNDTAGIDMTGMALQALAPYYDNSAYPEVKPAVDKALKYFKENIKTNAGFIEFGSENSCTTAQVLTAVSALNIDPTAKDSGFVQNGNNMISNLHTYKKDAGFAWQTTMQGQEMATQQVTYALVAYQRMAEGQTRLYDFTDVPEENPSVKPEAPKGTVTLTVERFTIGQGYFVEPVKVPFEEGDNGATLLKKVIGAENYIGNDAFLKAIKGADLGLDKVEVPDYIVKLSENETTTEKVKEYGNESNGPEALGEFDYSDDGKWVFFVNNKEPGSGTANYKPKDGDVLRFQFSVYGYGTDVTGQDWSGETVIEFSNKDRLTNLMAEVNKDKDNLMAHANVKNAYDAASKAISAVITPQKEIDALSDRLSEAMKNPGQPDIEDQKAAKEVEEKISGIGKVTLESKKAIEAARAAYDKLSENQKKLVSNLEILTKAEAELKKLEEEANTGYVIISVERFTIGQGFIHEPVKVPFEKGDNAATLLKKVIGAENFVGEDSYLRAIEGADLGVDKVVVPDYIAEISKNKVTTETARENGNDGDTALGEFDYSQMSGWMYHVNGKAVGYGISDYKPVNGDVLRFQFTMYGYGTDLTGTSWGNPNPVITISNKDNLVAKMADVNENRDRWMAVPAVKAVYDEAVKAMEAVITPKTEIDAITEKLDKAMKDHELTENDQEVANTVIEKINGIGKVTLESKKAIEEARAAYDKLSKNQKKLVSNLETLTKAEAELKKLEEEAVQAEADKKAAEAVVEKINGIGKVTLESKKAIEEARAAYDKLSKNQKKLVSNLETLTKAEAELKKLEEEAVQAEADKKAAEAVVEKINGIGKVTLESKKTIEEARAAYEKLSEAQKKLVSNLETLTKAEAELKKLEEQQGQQGQQGQEKPETSSVTLVNKKYGVSLQGEGLTEDMELQVEALNKDSKDVERMRKEITSKKSIFRLFNIKLMKDGKEIQLPQKAILSIPVGEKYNGKELVVLACSDKDIKQLKGKVTNGSVSVEVTELMSFGVVVDTAASGNEVNGGSGAGTTNSNGGGNSSGGKGVKTGDETQVGMLILLLTLSGAAVVMTAGKKRREQK